ncbi:MAG: CapA family protein, partial [Patescibacteria group bacterium]
QVAKDVAATKPPADIVIVTMHAGTEYTTQPTDQQVTFARAAIDAGADLVIGHHPHWPQIVEPYNGKWIFYSLGNFVFDQEWSRETKAGLILEAQWQAKQLRQLKLIPVVIENYSTPRLATTDEAQEILQRIGVTDQVIFSSPVDSPPEVRY